MIITFAYYIALGAMIRNNFCSNVLFALISQAFLTFNLLKLSKIMRQILNTQCSIRSLAHDDRTIKVKKLEQTLITTLSKN